MTPNPRAIPPDATLSNRAWICRQSAAAIVLGLLVAAPALPITASTPRALGPGELPQDDRLHPPKDLDGYFPFHPSATPEDWTARADQVRRQVQVALGLWPTPPKTPLNPVIHGKIERDNYTVEKVFF